MVVSKKYNKKPHIRMSQHEFKELDIALKEEDLSVIKPKKGKNAKACKHEDVEMDPTLNVPVCKVCFKPTDFGKSAADASANFSRCFARKVADKSIFKDIDNLDIPKEIVHDANVLYTHVTKGKTCRAKNRQGLIFACVFYAYQHSNKPQSLDQLNVKFNLPAKVISKGVKQVGLVLAGINMKHTYITAKDLIPDIMSRLNAGLKQVSEVQKLFDRIDGKSVVLNRSKPRSVACGVVYYYIKHTNRTIPIDQFAKKVELSELTIEKVMKEIDSIVIEHYDN